MNQTQIKISISDQLSIILKSKADRLGLPITQFVKYLIIKDIENEQIPVFAPSDRTINKTVKAIEEIDKAITLDNIDDLDSI